MFKFLFGNKGKFSGVEKNQRATVTRAIEEVNEVLAQMDEKPAISYDPATGAITLNLPDQMPDEALALPAPDAETSEEPKA